MGRVEGTLANLPQWVEVVLLTQPDCGFCDHARTVLERVGLDFALRISAIELGTPAGEALAREGGVLFPPGVFLDGQLFSYGRLSERKLRRELNRR